MASAIVYLITAVLIIFVVAFHHETQNVLVNSFSKRSRRRQLLYVTLALLLTHIIDIWVFAGAYALLAGLGGFGEIVNAASFPDYVYFSAAVYTTLGFGDLYPLGQMRIIAGFEALLGLSLIAWSASFVFYRMQQHWSHQASTDQDE